ncbi:hypothetical protein C8R44DRAFT_911509 [Mycena epipterygia]|nr:hypothetical protein C8R44DRAFT_911509 [Mycena epipterygia]
MSKTQPQVLYRRTEQQLNRVSPVESSRAEDGEGEVQPGDDEADPVILDEPDEGGEILSESEDGGQKKNKMKRPSVHVEADDLMGDRVIANELMKSCLSKTWAEDDITKVTTNSTTLDSSVAWFDFLRAIDGEIHRFDATADPSKDFENVFLSARCGYEYPLRHGLPISALICPPKVWQMRADEGREMSLDQKDMPFSRFALSFWLKQSD